MLRFPFLKFVFVFFFSFCALKSLSAQQHVTVDKNELAQASAKANPLNKTDSLGHRQGLWYIQEKHAHNRLGDIYFGHYQDGAKQGIWYHLDKWGRLISKKTYQRGVLDGVSKFYKKGHLVCIGHYRGLNPDNKIDSVWVTNPLTGTDTMILVPSEKGSVMHGLWKYYNPVSGQLVSESFYQVGYLLYEKKFHPKENTEDSLYLLQQPQHRPINIERVSRKIPKRARQKIGY